MSDCEHDVLEICEEVEEVGPVSEHGGEPIFDSMVMQFYRCVNCGARVEGEPPLLDDCE